MISQTIALHNFVTNTLKQMLILQNTPTTTELGFSSSSNDEDSNHFPKCPI